MEKNNNKFYHKVYKLPNLKNDILDTKPDVIQSNNHPQPLFKYGFHYYIHQTKDKMSITNSDKYRKKKFYHVVNDFEHKIDNLKDDEIDICKKTLNIFNITNDTPGILSRAFYKLWEIIMNFNIIDIKIKILVLHILQKDQDHLFNQLYFLEKCIVIKVL